MSNEEISSADLHPLLQREDARRANRRKRGMASPNNTLENSSGDTDSSTLIPESDSSLSLRLTQMQTSIEALQCSDQFLKKENSILIEKLAAANSIDKENETERGRELRAALLQLEKSRQEGKKLCEEMRLLTKRTAYTESELETCKLKLCLSETRVKEAEGDLLVCQKKLDENDTQLSAMRSRESEVTRLISEAESDKRSLERMREVHSTLTQNSHTIDELRCTLLSGDRKCSQLEGENSQLRKQLDTAEREKRGLELNETVRVNQLQDRVVGLEEELVKVKAESLTNDKRLAGIDKAKEAELNYLKDQLNTKDQLIICKALALEGLRKEAESCRQDVKGMNVAMEIKEFELEQLRGFKIRVKLEKDDVKQLSSMKETLSDIQNKYEELTAQTQTEREDSLSKQEALLSQISELKKTRKSLIKQLKQLEQLYTAKENTHTSMETEFSKLSQLFYALKEHKLIPDSGEVQRVLESVYQPSQSKLPELSSIRMESQTPELIKPGLKRSLSAGSELKSILKKSNEFSPRCSTPNSSQPYSPNLAYTATKHKCWLSDKEISDVL